MTRIARELSFLSITNSTSLQLGRGSWDGAELRALVFLLSKLYYHRRTKEEESHLVDFHCYSRVFFTFINGFVGIVRWKIQLPKTHFGASLFLFCINKCYAAKWLVCTHLHFLSSGSVFVFPDWFTLYFLYSLGYPWLTTSNIEWLPAAPSFFAHKRYYSQYSLEGCKGISKST